MPLTQQNKGVVKGVLLLKMFARQWYWQELIPIFLHTFCYRQVSIDDCPIKYKCCPHDVNMEHLESNQFDKLLSSEERALVMFYADWCPFCHRFKPIFESATITKSGDNGYKFYESKVNDDENPLWDRFSINAVPTLLAFDKGKIVSRRDAKMGVGLSGSDLDSLLKEI
jgi:thioredoxin 1